MNSYPSRRAAFWSGARVSAGAPSAVLAAGYLGFAALAKAGQFPLWAALLSTATIWALPGQLVMVEMMRAGAAAAVTVIAVAFTAMRFLPMTLSFMPLVREPRHRPWQIYLSAHVLAMTNWALCIGRVRELPPEQRLAYFLGFAVTNWLVCIATTLVGYALVDSFPPLVSRGLVMIAPLYYILILSNQYRDRIASASLLLGAACGPLLYRMTPQWSILLAGLIGGTAAYLAFRRRA
ncbi:MAG: AzlC family ABC transporter permease [Burkholderiales bacterium]